MRVEGAMADQVRVTLADPRGLDDGKTLQAELERETGVPWTVTEQPHNGHLSVTVTIVLTAVAVKIADKATDKIADKTVNTAADLLTERAHKAVDWWKERYLDPPEITVEVDDDSGECAADSQSVSPDPQG